MIAVGGAFLLFVILCAICGDNDAQEYVKDNTFGFIFAGIMFFLLGLCTLIIFLFH